METRNRIRDLLAEKLGDRAGGYDIPAMADELRIVVGDVVDLGQVDPDALDDGVERHKRRGRYARSTCHEEMVDAMDEDDDLI